MNKPIGELGDHKRAEVVDCEDCNGRVMVKCNDCGTYAHAFSEREAIEDLSKCKCVRYCSNCKNLRNSNERKPAIPVGGTCNDILHVCPNDGNRWWQANNHFHHWQQVTSDREWESLKNQKPYDYDAEEGFTFL